MEENPIDAGRPTPTACSCDPYSPLLGLLPEGPAGYDQVPARGPEGAERGENGSRPDFAG